MGAACCVASRDKTVGNRSGSENLSRNIRHSPNWSFRWDNRGRVAGEETSVNWLSDRASQNDRSEIKYDAACSSGEGSPLEQFPRHTWGKSPASEGTTTGLARTSISGLSISRNVSTDASLEQIKESTVSPTVTIASPVKQSLSFPSTSSLSMSPLSSQSQIPTTSAAPMWPTPGYKSPVSGPGLPYLGNESVQGSHGGSSDGWSLHAFSELVANSRRERWSFDSESFGYNRDKMARSTGLVTASESVDFQTCAICSKLLIEKSLWCSQKIISNNELSVVSVLTCGHAYHAECLENMTPEVNKYDPACPVCTLGEKQTIKLSEKVLKAEMELKTRNRRLRNQIVDSDLRNSWVLDRTKSIGHRKKDLIISSSSVNGGSSGRTFLKRHFSFGSKGSRILSGNNRPVKKGFFWTKSCKV